MKRNRLPRHRSEALPAGRAQPAEAIVAGHICLDIIPDLGDAGLETIAVPGALINVGGAVVTTGGTVANCGVALHRLGIQVKLMGKIGDDPFGTLIADTLRREGETLAESLIVGTGEQSSYSIVISPRGSDRMFLHAPGANDTFASDDVTDVELDGARLFHFGYPPLMKAMYADGGRELEKLLARAKAKGLTVSLDMSRPDPGSPAGKVDWTSLLARVLPYVDVYMPSWEETLFMLDGPGAGHSASAMSGDKLAELSGRLLAMGPAVVGIKLGEEGLYVRTTGDAERLERFGRCRPSDPASWTSRELLAPCFEVEAAGTTGAGDCTIAGFLAALLHGLPLEGAMTGAVAVGACNVEAVDATSGIVPWADVQRRIAAGWARRPTSMPLPGWRTGGADGLRIGPHDRAAFFSL
ncbi:carbohydrate kinase family protein [Paenibacillus flagellatus]|uniref:Carbohydrate kinase family protein n=1 Tax=Paenibacillus flagellatus TaxID=2211139 RepID=A0A2V5KLC0_9BACL|nr:carbohydrate kinase family protein [Paenibacillus flagellatus]PYI55780.1 carbohydrate kinase family protein [Paenibacillus flagellatus]